MKLLEELEILLETRQPYANGNAEKCYPQVTELIQQLRAAQHHAHLTPGSRPVFCVCCGGEVSHPVCTDCLPSPAQVA